MMNLLNGGVNTEKIITGSAIMLSGVIISMSIIIAAAVYMPGMMKR